MNNFTDFSAIQRTNIAMICRVAQAFGPELGPQVVFLGGASLALLVNDPAASDARPTKDVDVIVEVASYLAYHQLAERLRLRGFREDMTEGAPVCRWVVDGVTVDVMPTQEDVFHFGNRWYVDAFRHSKMITLPESLPAQEIRLIAAPYFLATKLEAYADRGKNDLLASHDMEDIFALVDGRATLFDEILGEASEELKTFLGIAFQKIQSHRDYRDAVEGNLPDTSVTRLPLLMERIKKIAALAK